MRRKSLTYAHLIVIQPPVDIRCGRSSDSLSGRHLEDERVYQAQAEHMRWENCDGLSRCGWARGGGMLG